MAPRRLAVLGVLLLAACASSPKQKSSSAPHPPNVDLVVDANRDGALDLQGITDEAGKNDFTAKAGAVVLANLDDDDQDGQPDATESHVAGDADTQDLSPIAVRAFPSAPNGAVGVLSVDSLGAAHAKLFRVTGSRDLAADYTLVPDPSHVSLATGDVRAGEAFAIEATAFVGTTNDGWDGTFHLTYEVDGATGKPLGIDHAMLRVAPVLFQWNTAKTERVYYTGDADAQDTSTDSLRDGVKPVCTGGIEETPIELGDTDYDQWAQDFFDVAYTSRPGPGGKPIGMKVYTRSPQPDRPAGGDVLKAVFGPNVATVYLHGPSMANGSGNGYSMSSFGNFDVVPPYDKGSEHYPLGRNFWGKGPTPADQPDPVYTAFVSAQQVQPEIHIDTTFLLVGHVDEITSFVETNTPRGWGLLAAKPALARSMLQQMQAAGDGSTQMFVGKEDFDYMSWDGSGNPRQINGAVSIDDVLGNADLMAESQKAEVAIDAAVSSLQSEIGLADSEITPMPFLFEPVLGSALAYQPGTVNLLHVDGRVVVPEPFGPMINGVDPFKADAVSRLSALGLDVFFADDWDTYHIEMGEVHCGTNVSRDLGVKWWESGR